MLFRGSAPGAAVPEACPAGSCHPCLCSLGAGFVPVSATPRFPVQMPSCVPSWEHGLTFQFLPQHHRGPLRGPRPQSQASGAQSCCSPGLRAAAQNTSSELFGHVALAVVAACCQGG